MFFLNNPKFAVLGIASALPAFLTVLASAVQNRTKTELLNKIDAFVESRKRRFKLKEDTHLTNHNKLVQAFIFVSFLSFVGSITNALIHVPHFFGLYLQYEIFTITLNVQNFQILTYANMILEELKASNQIDLDKLNRRGLRKFKANLVDIQSMVQEISNCLQLPILCTTFWNFFSVLEDSTLIVIYFLGNYSAGLFGTSMFQFLSHFY